MGETTKMEQLLITEDIESLLLITEEVEKFFREYNAKLENLKVGQSMQVKGFKDINYLSIFASDDLMNKIGFLRNRDQNRKHEYVVNEMSLVYTIKRLK